MNSNLGLLDSYNIVPAIIPIDLATGANAGDYVCLKGYERCVIVVLMDAGTAGQDPIINLQQATAVAGTGAKDLLFTDIAEKQGATALSAVGAWTLQTQTAATSYTSATGGENEQLIVIDIQAEMLDVANGFDCLALDIADTGATAGKIGAALYILGPARYGQARGSELSAIAD